MPRIRTFKPEHRQHRKVGPLDHVTYRLWAGMILEADDEGRLVCDARQLAALIFAYHQEVSREILEASLNVLETLGLIRLYAQNGTRYADFPSWLDHQRINHPTPSKLPPYDDSLKIREDSGSPRENSRGIGKERKGTTTQGTPQRGVLADDEFLAHLQKSPAYKGLDMDRELAKLDTWLLTPRGRGKKKTRGRIVAWLNRALEELPLASQGGDDPYRNFPRA